MCHANKHLAFAIVLQPSWQVQSQLHFLKHGAPLISASGTRYLPFLKHPVFIRLGWYPKDV
ncbi:hypothetical protein A4R26_31400 [Niastella populi]|uniref:Uncharacterized protein n=1 Tax=Niastella populi TaxID=550983 RepID=A0A1V9EQ31_9BACT|nr:hypothetical protein A4R26_31400 [Niastella populi]